jgi:ATPase subunit of ABC transporter with duplicated ATPase domains
MNRFTDTEKNNFYRAADSLRKYRRAELVDDETGRSTLAELYCDPLPAQGLSNRINSSNTTLIVGRKGTGKSTVFQKLQHDVRKSNDRLTAYIDIKTIWDSSQVDVGLQERVAAIDFALPPATIQRMLMYRTFLSNVVEEIKRELNKRLKESLVARIKNAFTGRFDDLKKELDAFQSDYSDDNFVRILGVKTLGLKEHAEAKHSQTTDLTRAQQVRQMLVLKHPAIRNRLTSMGKLRTRSFQMYC